MLVAARRQRKDVEGTVVTARVGIGPIEGGAYGLAVELRIAVPNLTRAEAEALVAA